MRLVIKLTSFVPTAIPVNYNYPLSAAIYNLLRFGSPEFAEFLHDKGYVYNNKTYKLFTFALKFENAAIRKSDSSGRNLSFILKSPDATLYVSSPMIDTFIQNFVIGTFEKQSLIINSGYSSARFEISSVESLPEIQITDRMKFSLLSPLVLSTKRNYNGQLKQYYLRPDDTDEINRVLTQNLINKYKLVHNKELDTDELKLDWDKAYLNSHERITKKVTIKEASKAPIDIIGIQAPFTLSGNSELIKIGYAAGIGEKNALGFGFCMAEAL